MHIADAHREMLPDDVPPMPMPDSKAEADFLLQCLDAGLYPTLDLTEASTDQLSDSSFFLRMNSTCSRYSTS
jgi:hypothetical protein